jgi:hypothetical protein
MQLVWIDLGMWYIELYPSYLESRNKNNDYSFYMGMILD